MTTYDIGIIGAGVAGCFAALRLAEKYKNKKIILFELGPPPPNWIRKDPIRVKRRRRQLEGWFGCFPTGDGKVYADDLDKVNKIADGRAVTGINKWFFSYIDQIAQPKLNKQKLPSTTTQSKISEAGFELKTHDYYQWYPNAIHELSRLIADKIEEAGNVNVMFDCEVFDFEKRNRTFVINTSDGEFKTKKVILNVGRSSWRWVNKLYNNLGILKENKSLLYGFNIELPAQYLKDFNKSHCSFSNDELYVGPLNWNGSIIQEDHSDVTLAAFRSNEKRWESDKVFFSLLIKKEHEKPMDQVDRISKLAFLLSGDRVGRERIKSFLKNDGVSQIALIPEFNWAPEVIKKLECIFPQISRGYLHTPSIFPMMADINISSNWETDIKGLFVAGESANLMGIVAAAISGALAAEGAVK